MSAEDQTPNASTPEPDDQKPTAETCDLRSLGASHGWASSVSAALSGYLENRSKLMDQLIHTNLNQAWNGHEKAVREIREDIKTIDERVAEIVRQMLMPNIAMSHGAGEPRPKL
jgi:hypothetical protein